MTVESKSPKNPGRRRGRKFSDGDPKLSKGSKDVLGDNTQSGSMLIKLSVDSPTWHQLGEEIHGRNATLVSDPPPTGSPSNRKNLIEKYKSAADELYRKEILLFGKHGDKKDMTWIQSTISKGTLKDRIAAMSVVASTHPVHKFHALDGLLQMAGCLSEGQANSRVAQLAAAALEDLFLNTFLPPNRKLITLAQRPLYLYERQEQSLATTQDLDKNTLTTTKRTLSPRVLLLWRFEEMVKDKYQLFLSQYIGFTLREGTEQQKIPTIRTASKLLRSVPEGEAILLSMMVNKLGDPSKKVAATAAHELRQVLLEHPAMKTVVAREVQQLAHRPHLSSRALYNCITFLNQLQFTRRDIHKKDDDDDANANHQDGGSFNSQSLPASLISTYFRLFEVAVNMESAKKDADSVALKGRLLSALLTGVNRAHPFLPEKDKVMDEHVDALYRVVYKAPPGACTQALLLLFHLAVGSKLDGDDDNDNDKESNRPSLKPLSDQEKERQDRFYQTLYSRLFHSELLRSGKHLTMFFNLIYKAMKYDSNTTRVIAFAKQVLSTTMHCSPPVAAASVFLLNEVAKFHQPLAKCFSNDIEGIGAHRTLDFRSHDPFEALVVVQGSEEEDQQQQQVSKTEDDNEVKLAPMWEISMLLKHHHPSVAHFASKMGAIDYAGDPLRDFALTPFLDKFAYRNPKSAAHIESKLERARKSVAARQVGTESLVDRKSALPFNDPSFLEKKDIAVQDEFFYRFFVERAKRDKIKGIDRQHGKAKGQGEEGEEDGVMDKFETKDFDAYEQNWGTDEEEEAFADELAQKIIEDSADANDLGPNELDEEDPDTTGWDDESDDSNNDDEDDDNGGEVLQIEDALADTDGTSDSETELKQKGASDDDDDDDDDDDADAFMEEHVNDSSDSDDEAPELMELKGEGTFVDPPGEEGDDLNQEGETDRADEESQEEEPTTKNKRKKQKTDTLYASAQDYEDQINEAWYKITNAASSTSPKPALEAHHDLKKKKRKAGRKV